MTAQTFFQATNTLALVAWIALIAFPGKKLLSGWLRRETAVEEPEGISGNPRP
jgi:hypothetical protein